MEARDAEALCQGELNGVSIIVLRLPLERAEPAISSVALCFLYESVSDALAAMRGVNQDQRKLCRLVPILAEHETPCDAAVYIGDHQVVGAFPLYRELIQTLPRIDAAVASGRLHPTPAQLDRLLGWPAASFDMKDPLCRDAPIDPRQGREILRRPFSQLEAKVGHGATPS